MATTVETRSMRGAELLGLVAFALALMLLIALATFDPRDPAPFFKAGVEGPARNFIGPFGAFLAEMLIPQLFGLASLLLPIVLGLLGWKLFWCKPIDAPYTKVFGNGVLLLSLAGLLSLAVGTVSFEGEPVRAGGAVGELVSRLLVADFSRTGAYILAATALFVALILSTQFSFSTFLAGRRQPGRRAPPDAADRLGPLPGEPAQGEDAPRRHPQAHRGQGRRRRPAAHPEGEGERRGGRRPSRRTRSPTTCPSTQRPRGWPRRRRRPLPFAALADEPEDEGPEAPRPRAAARRRRAARDASATGGEVRGNYTLPPITILDEAKGGAGVDNDRLLEKGRILQSKCSEFGVMGTVKEIHPGPVVTTYEFKPDAGVKYSKIVGLADDLALALEAESIRVDRISGKGNVGIEIPNEVRETIYLREILESDTFRALLGPPDPRARQGRERRRLDDRPRGDAPPADRRLHRHRQERGPQLHDREHPLPLDPGRGASSS